MSVLPGVSPSRKMPGKRSFEDGDFNPHTNLKHPKLDANNRPKIHVPHRSVAKEFFSSNLKHQTAAIPAVPLRSIAPTDEMQGSGNSSRVHGKKGKIGKPPTDKNEKKTCSSDEAWKSQSDNLTELLAQAKEFLTSFDSKYSNDPLSKDLPEPKTGKVPEKRGDENLAEERVKIEDWVSGTQSMWEDDSDDEVSILSPEEWKLNRKGKTGHGKPSTEKTETKPENLSSSHNVTDSPGIEIIDLEDMPQNEEISDSEVFENKSGEEFESEEESENLAIVEVYDELKSCGNKMELINLSMEHDESQASKVREALELFDKHYAKFLRKDVREGKISKAHYEVADRLKPDGMWIYNSEKPFGHVPGIEIGLRFRFRAELAVVGLHRQFVSGIDYVSIDGNKYATSVVNSGRYENKAKTRDVLIYSGQGGNPKLAEKAMDQKLEQGNLALKNSMEKGFPVRVIYKSKCVGPKNKGNYVYIYDGLYTVNGLLQDRDQNGKLVFKFELHRMPDQPRPRSSTVSTSRKFLTQKEVCVLDDVSDGRENLKIRAMNGIDDERPPPFTYRNKIVYPNWFRPIKPVSCDCVDGCSDSRKCPCVIKNGGEIPFNEKGAIIRAKPRVYECGPSCKCSPSCMNRVTQHGPRHQLEIFKTEKRGWGVRSRTYISSGSFICEYIGELLRDKEAEQRIGDDEYLFDIGDSRDEVHEDGFAVDAAKFGNLGRFINHSCSPNLYAQEVLFDHYDKRMPHVMFFATRNIAPLHELTYDYNYKVGVVCDVNGNVRTKACYCGSGECSGRMY